MNNDNTTYEISIEEIKKITTRREKEDFYMEDGTLVKVWSNEETD